MTVEMNALLATYDLDGANQARLQKASKMVMALLPEVLDHFYDRVGREPEMAAFFKSDKMLERAKESSSNIGRDCFPGSIAKTINLRHVISVRCTPASACRLHFLMPATRMQMRKFRHLF